MKITMDNHISNASKHSRIRKVDCAIIGAGAAGLQCATSLLEQRKSSVLSSSPNNEDEAPKNTNGPSLVVLEARDRIGGRILTTHERTASIGQNDHSEILLCKDEGAAWVHGAHKSNPMMQLLEEAEQSQPPRALNPIFEGNPWVRPHTVLHRNGMKEKSSLISFFVNGSKVPEGISHAKEIDEDSRITLDAPTLSRSSLSTLAIRRHYRVLRQIASTYTSDDNKVDKQCSVNQLYEQFNADANNFSSPNEDEKDEDEKKLIALLAPFYLYLMENWNGISMNETKVDEVLHLFIPDQEIHCEEENDEYKKEITMPETDEQYVSAGDFDGPHCKVKTGMFTVLKPLSQALERHHHHQDESIICLGEEVIGVVDEQSHVRIETKSGNRIEAKCCVSTIPLGCLQHHISSSQRESFFQPRLCDDKIEAINSIWSGSYKKVFLTFDHIFWPKDPPIIGLVRNLPIDDIEGCPLLLPGRYLLLYNLWAPDNIPSIEATLCGDLGKWAFQKSDEIIQQAVIEFIETAMGLSNLFASCKDCRVTRWEEDEFSRGSYSTFQLETLDRHVDALGSSEWNGRLVFAGEATENDHMGSVHAALMSGKRASKTVLDFLSSSNAK